MSWYPVAGIYRFGAFEFDSTSGDLRKHGIRIKLQDQPARLLGILLERAGGVVTRDELRGVLWPDGTNVDFDSGLNTAVKKLRQALSDEATQPKYVETLPKRGYRFIGTAELVVPAVKTEERVEIEVVPAPVPATSRRFYWFVAAMAGVALALVAWWIARRAPGQAPDHGPVAHLTVALGPHQSMSTLGGRSLALSSDGRQIAYIASESGARRLYLRTVDNAEASVVPGVTDPADVVFLPSGDGLLVSMSDAVQEVGPDGRPRALEPQGRLPVMRSVWGPDGSLYYTRAGSDPARLGGEIWRKPAGEKAGRVPIPYRGPGVEVQFPEQVISRNRLIYQTARGPTDREILLFDPASGQSTALASPGMGGWVLPTGHFVYYWAESLWAAPFSEEQGKLRGTPQKVVENVRAAGWAGPNAAFSKNGTLIYVAEPPVADNRLVWVNLEGKETPLPIPPAPLVPVDVTQDGSKLLLSRLDPVTRLWSLWEYRLNGGESIRLVSGLRNQNWGVWSPDGKEVAFAAEEGGDFPALRRMAAAPDSRTRRVHTSPVGHAIQGWHRRNNVLLFTQGRTPGTLIDIWTVGADGTKPRVVVETASDDVHPALSPDGRWLAWVKVGGNAHRIFVQPFEGGQPLAVPADEGQAPMWAPDGNALFFRSGDRFLRIPVRPGNPPQFGPIKELFRGDYLRPTAWQTNTVLSPDGKRFLLAKPDGNPADNSRIEVITNWFDEVSRKVSVGRL